MESESYSHGAQVYAAGWVGGITPKEPAVLGGSIRPLPPTDAVVEPIEVDVIALRDHLGEEVILVSFDLLYVGKHLRRAVEEAFSHVSPVRILTAATHTHRAPMTDASKPLLGATSEAYIAQVEEVLIAIAAKHRTGGESLRRSHLHFSRVEVHLAINRRRFRRFTIGRRPSVNSVVMAPNPKGFVRDELLVCVWRTSSGKPTAVLWNYACHPVAHPSGNSVAAHFPHIVRQRLRRHYKDPNLPVVYLQGFSGNVRPLASARSSGFMGRLARLLKGPMFSDMTQSAYHSWSGSLAEEVLLATQDALPQLAAPLFVCRNSVAAVNFVNGGSAPVTFQAARLTPRLVIAGVSAEVVAEYVPIIESLFPGEDLILVGCLDDTFGYAPTSEQLSEGGYEAGGYCATFGLRAVSPSIEKALVAGFTSVLEGLRK